MKKLVALYQHTCRLTITKVEGQKALNTSKFTEQYGARFTYAKVAV